MSDIQIDRSGASALDQRHLQRLILAVNPDALSQYGVDGDFGAEGRAALQEILEANNIDFSEGMSIKEAIAAVSEIPHAKVDISSDVISRDTPSDQVKYIQELVHHIDPKLMPKSDIDGIAGKQVMGALEALSTNVTYQVGVDLTTSSIDDIITNLQQQIALLPDRYEVDDCDNLTVIAREVYAEDIDQYTKDLMESGDSRFDTETKARVHAEQIAVNKIATANELDKGPTDAHLIFPDQILVIPEEGSLKGVDATLDWEALDGEVGPGGPCGCDGDSPLGPSPREITTTFTPAVTNPPTTDFPTLTEGDCVAEYQGQDRQGRHMYSQEGTSGNLHDEVRALYKSLGIDKGRSLGSCTAPSGGDPDPEVEAHTTGISDTTIGDTTTDVSTGLSPSVGLGKP